MNFGTVIAETAEEAWHIDLAPSAGQIACQTQAPWALSIQLMQQEHRAASPHCHIHGITFALPRQPDFIEARVLWWHFSVMALLAAAGTTWEQR
jgi:hypothetical protein